MTADPLVDGVPASRHQELPPGQARDLARLRRETPCARCGGGAPSSSPLVTVETRLGAQAWRACPTCTAQATTPAVAWDVLETLGVPVRAVVGDDRAAVDRAARQQGAPPPFARTADAYLAQSPDGRPVGRWAHNEVGRWLGEMQPVVRREAADSVLRPSPAGTPCPRCGRAQDRSWRSTGTDEWNPRSVSVCSTCPTSPWGPRGPVTDDRQVRAAAVSDVHATPWDRACMESAGYRTRHHPIPGIAQLSGWFPPERHPQWPSFPDDAEPWAYLPEGTAEQVCAWVDYITAPQPVPAPLREPVASDRPARIQ